jgi:hypothetical protein
VDHHDRPHRTGERVDDVARSPGFVDRVAEGFVESGDQDPRLTRSGPVQAAPDCATIRAAVMGRST